MPSDARLRRSHRLRAPQEFQQCFTHGVRVHGRCFRMHACFADVARLGLAVSRKVDPHAVGRNRIKRIARESFRRVRAHLPPLDCALVAKPEAARASATELRADLAELWRRAGALKRQAPAGTMRGAPPSPSDP